MRHLPRYLAIVLAVTPFAVLTLRGGERGASACAPDNGGLALPEGFCASRIADDVGQVRHLAVAPSGDLYAAVCGMCMT